MTVTFKFSLGQKVTVPFGDVGVISMLGVNEGGNTYFVENATGRNWFEEAQLTA